MTKQVENNHMQNDLPGNLKLTQQEYMKKCGKTALIRHRGLCHMSMKIMSKIYPIFARFGSHRPIFGRRPQNN